MKKNNKKIHRNNLEDVEKTYEILEKITLLILMFLEQMWIWIKKIILWTWKRMCNEAQKKINEKKYPWRLILGTFNGNQDNYARLQNELKEVMSLYNSSYIQNIQDFNNQYYSAYILSTNNLIANYTEDEINELVAHKVEKVVNDYLIYYNLLTPSFMAHDFIAVDYRKDMKELIIYVAHNPLGFDFIKQARKLIGSRYTTQYNEPIVQDSSIKCNNDNTMVWGYDLKEYKKNGSRVPLRFPIDTHLHALISGASGSGKSQSCQFLIANLLSAAPVRLYVLDYKNSEDYRYLQDYPHYYTGIQSIDGLRNYMNEFRKALNDGYNSLHHVIIIDEYQSWVNYLSVQDKLNKTKHALEVQMWVSEILSMGRALHFGIWIICQQPTATIFNTGTVRQNFMINIALGKLSGEHRRMQFDNIDFPERIYQVGEGVLLADGHDLLEVKYPLINDIQQYKYNIFRLLMEEHMD